MARRWCRCWKGKTMISDLTRGGILEDARRRLRDATDAGDRVWASRLHDLPDADLPALCLYVTDEEGTALGGHASWVRRITFAIEGRVAQGRGWSAAANRLTDQALARLFADPDWTETWREMPDYRMRQFLDGSAATPVCGELLTLTLAPARALEIKPAAPLLAGITTRALTPDGAEMAETANPREG